MSEQELQADVERLSFELLAAMKRLDDAAPSGNRAVAYGQGPRESGFSIELKWPGDE